METPGSEQFDLPKPEHRPLGNYSLGSEMRSDQSQPEAQALNSRTAFYVLQAIKQKSAQTFDLHALDQLVSRGHLTEFSAEYAEEKLAKTEAAAEARREGVRLDQTIGSLKTLTNSLTDQLGSPLYRLFSLSWLGSSKLEQERAELAKLQQQLDAQLERKADLERKIHAGDAAQNAVEHLANISGRYFTLSASGERLLQRLHSQRAILPDLSLEQFEEGMHNLSGSIQSRIIRFEQTMALLARGGFNIKAEESINLGLALSQQRGALESIIQNASVLDDQLEAFKLPQKQRIHLVEVVSGISCEPLQDLQRMFELAEELKKKGKGMKSSYECLYVAAQLSLSDEANPVAQV